MQERGASILDGQPGFTPHMGRLVAMLAYARRTTLKAVEGLTAAQLDHLHDPLSNSIGASHTLRELAARDDMWLAETTPSRGGRAVSNYFRWFHVLEDEISHRGQTRWLRQRVLGTS